MKTLRAPHTTFALGVAIFAASLVVFAQTPQQTAPAGQPGSTTPPTAQDATGRGGAEGRGRGGGGRQDLTGIDFTKQPSVLAKTPEEELKTFILQPGYRLELVLGDPIIQEPTAIAFDGNGRMRWASRPRSCCTTLYRVFTSPCPLPIGSCNRTE